MTMVDQRQPCVPPQPVATGDAWEDAVAQVRAKLALLNAGLDTLEEKLDCDREQGGS